MIDDLLYGGSLGWNSGCAGMFHQCNWCTAPQGCANRGYCQVAVSQAQGATSRTQQYASQKYLGNPSMQRAVYHSSPLDAGEADSDGGECD